MNVFFFLLFTSDIITTALFRSLTTQLIKHDKITTTLMKAKQLRTFIDKMVTLAKKNTPHTHNQIKSYLYEEEAIQKAIQTFPERFKERQGGYTSIERLWKNRRGDNAIMATVTLLDAEKAPEFVYEKKTEKKEETPEETLRKFSEQMKFTQ